MGYHYYGLRFHHSQKGFTLIELMITVVIIGVLSAVAIPAYQDYVARSQVSEGLALVSGAKPLVAEYHANHGEYPNLAQSGFTGATGKYISSTTIGDNGQIIATLGGQANTKITGKTLILTPKQETSGNLSWDCTSSAEEKYLPSSCLYISSEGTTNPADSSTWADFSTFWNLYQYDNGVITLRGNTIDYLGDDEQGNRDYSFVNGAYTYYLKVTPEHDLIQCYSTNCVTGARNIMVANTNGSTGNIIGNVINYIDSNGKAQSVVAYLPQTVSNMVANGSYPNTAENNIAGRAWNDISNTYHNLQSTPSSATLDAYNASVYNYISTMKTLQTQGYTLSEYDTKFIQMMDK